MGLFVSEKKVFNVFPIVSLCELYVALATRVPIQTAQTHIQPGFVAQWVVSLIADTGDVSLIPAWPHTFMEIDCEIFSSVIDSLLLSLIQGLLLVTSVRMCTEYWLTT